MSNEYPIFWTEEADTTYFDTISFILEKWTVKEVEAFEALTFDLLHQLRFNLKLCPELKKLKVRKCVISAQTSLIYRVNRKSIELLAFIDNRSQHSY